MIKYYRIQDPVKTGGRQICLYQNFVYVSMHNVKTGKCLATNVELSR